MIRLAKYMPTNQQQQVQQTKQNKAKNNNNNNNNTHTHTHTKAKQSKKSSMSVFGSTLSHGTFISPKQKKNPQTLFMNS